MKQYLFVGILLVTCVLSSNAQSGFQRLYQHGTNIRAKVSTIQKTMDGGFLLAGTDSSITGDHDMFLVRTDAGGDTLWARSYGTSGFEYGQNAIQTSDGGYMLVGTTLNSTWDIYLVRTDAAGDTLWTRIVGGSLDDEANFVQQTNDGNFIVTGYTNSYGAGNYDYFLMKIDPAGTILWYKTYGTLADELGYAVFQAGDKGFIMTGAAATSNVIDVYAVKTDSMGVVQWSNYYGTADVDWGYMMRPTSDGGYAITGYVSTGTGGTDVLLIKTDALGDTLWTKTYGAGNFEQGMCVVQTSDGGYAVSGSVYDGSLGGSDAMLLKTDAAGNMIYCHGFGGSGDDWSPSLVQTSNKEFALGGYTNSLTGADYAFYLVNTDTLGNTIGNCNESFTTVQLTQAAISTTSLITTVNSPTVSLITSITNIDSWLTQAEGCASLAVQQIDKLRDVQLVNIYPNPSSGYFSLEMENISTPYIEICVLNILGETMHSERLQNSTGKINRQINLGEIAPGIYTVRLQMADKQISAKLMILK